MTQQQDQIEIQMTIRQPEMERTPLSYHLWLIMNRILLLLDRMLLHTAAIALNGNVNLFCGHKGAGKSSISVALGQVGATILAEDHVVLHRKPDHNYVVSGCTSRMRVTAATEKSLLRDRLQQPAKPVGNVAKKEFPAEQFFLARPYQDHS